jgi:rRNA-processing protein FCF1
MPITVLPDGNVLNYLAEHPDALAAVRTANASGAVRILETVMLRKELKKMKRTPDGLAQWRELTALLDSLMLEPVKLATFTLDASLLDDPDEQLATDEQAALHDTLSTSNAGHAVDATIAQAAREHDALLVTKDQGMIGRATKLDVAAVNPPALAWLARKLTDLE